MTTMPIETKVVTRTIPIPFYENGRTKRVKTKVKVKQIIYSDGTKLKIHVDNSGHGRLTARAYVKNEQAAYGSIDSTFAHPEDIDIKYHAQYMTKGDDEDEEYHWGTDDDPRLEVPYIVAVRTFDAFQRRGFGTQIMTTLHDILISEGHKLVILQATSEGRKLYETLGYQPLHDRPTSMMIKYFE